MRGSKAWEVELLNVMSVLWLSLYRQEIIRDHNDWCTSFLSLTDAGIGMPLTNSGNTSCFHSGSNLLRLTALQKAITQSFYYIGYCFFNTLRYVQTHVKNIKNECAVGDSRNDRSEFRAEWRKLHYHRLHDLYSILLLLVLMLGLLVKESERVCMYVLSWVHTCTHMLSPPLSLSLSLSSSLFCNCF